jgi:squalene-hopene/tetraprenyl-beta-curcumene cyclase
MRALDVWNSVLSQQSNKTQHSVSSDRIRQATERGWSYLLKNQQTDGSWLPLWFGNQDRPEEDNPVYGTGRVLKCFSQCNRSDGQAFRRGVHFLISCQNRDGGWGGGNSIHYPPRPEGYGTICKAVGSSTMEETAIALDGIMHQIDTTEHSDSIMAGLRRLSEFVLAGDHETSQPIGFYFAKLWYHERLYPMVFSLSALKKGLEICQR